MLANPSTAKAISITNNNNATARVNTLLGTNSGISIVGTPQYIGASAAAGTFTGGNSNANLGMDAGVILSTGKVSDAIGSIPRMSSILDSIPPATPPSPSSVKPKCQSCILDSVSKPQRLPFPRAI
ncbi:MAG: choice-of-anchor L domain-containing protein [Chamaesiphon sp.]|nr:choice-of-anchor L domain-containing protein [Chamaesiphon sp.]